MSSAWSSSLTACASPPRSPKPPLMTFEFGAPVRRVFRRLRTEGEHGIIQYGYKFISARAAV